MSSKIFHYDFNKHKISMIDRHGFSPEECEKSWKDLLIILSALEKEPDKTFALTVGADQALHGLLLDTVGHLRFSEAIFGTGSIVVHDPFAYGTPTFDAAWQRTRAAFAAEGIALPAHYLANGQNLPDPRRAEACFIFVARIADIRMAA